jgi:hypothetical protein
VGGQLHAILMLGHTGRQLQITDISGFRRDVYIRSAFFWNITWRRVLFTDVSGEYISTIFKRQEIQEEKKRHDIDNTPVLYSCVPVLYRLYFYRFSGFT